MATVNHRSMTVTDRSRAFLEDLRDRLENEYGDLRVVERTWRHPAPMYEGLVERFEDDEAGGAGAWVYDGDGRVLLLREPNRTAWTDPGDKRTPGESFEETAVRAVAERTGVEATVTDALELHRIEVYDGTDPERPHLYEPIVVFAAEHRGGDPAPGDGVDEVAWFEEHPPATQYDDVGSRPIPYDPD